MRPVEIGIPTPDGWRATTFAKHQPEYMPLPTLQNDGPQGDVMSRWRPTLWERVRLLFGADVWLDVLTYGNICRRCGSRHGLQPVQVWVGSPRFTVTMERADEERAS